MTFNRLSKSFLLFCGVLVAALPPAPIAVAGNGSIPSGAAQAELSQQAARSAAAKINAIQEGSLARGGPPIRISQQEANSYLQYEMAPEYPPGLSQVRLQFTPGHVQGTANVDFDKAKQSAHGPSSSLMDYLFFGKHVLTVEGALFGADGTGKFNLESVALDGVALPQALVQYLINRFLLTHYPGLSIDQPFALPFSISRVQLDQGSVVVAGSAGRHF